MHIYDDLKYITEKPADKWQLYIYVIENYPQGNIKIGRTINPVKRFKSLSGSNNGGNVIKRVAISPMTYLYSIECTCHNHFHCNRIKGTEYFADITFEEVVEYVDSLFESDGYNKCNEIRKKFYEDNPNNVPSFVNKEDTEEKNEVIEEDGL